MNPKFQTEYKQNRPKGNISKGHKGKFKKQHYTRKPRLADVTDSEIAELKSRYKFVSRAATRGQVALGCLRVAISGFVRNKWL